MSLFALFYMLLSYLLGSISGAILLCRVTGLPDPRTSGSHNPGATNVLRIGGRWISLAGGFFGILKRMFTGGVGVYFGVKKI